MKSLSGTWHTGLKISVLSLYAASLIAWPVGLATAQEQTTTPEPAATETTTVEPTTETTTAQTTPEATGPQEPTGPENPSFTYNESTGLWENEYYTWDPATKLTAPKTPQTYSYNPETEHWDTTEWVYTPQSGTYIPNTISSDKPPVEQTTSQTESQQPEVKNAPDSLPAISSVAVVPYNTQSPASPLSVDASSPQSTYDLFFDATISGSINSTAVSGDASVIQNTSAGNATTGNALVSANVINMIQSAFGFGAAVPELYTANIQGDYTGDIVIDPSMFLGVANHSVPSDLSVNAAVNGTINNDMQLAAHSGDATVSENTTAGSATTGDAAVVANIVNMITSSISSGQSFMGVLNIMGDLEGDVLLADDVIKQLLAANVPTAQLCLCADDDPSLAVDSQANHTISNTVDANAASGTALVSQNTNAGNATSGSANTNVTIFNLTGHQFVGANTLLVFVNVGGEWIGFLTDAPAGATAAAYGDSGEHTVLTGDTDINAEQNFTINNNLDLDATSGDASVTKNTTAGDATTGDASVQANIVNMTNSNFTLSGWFGLLFINIMGDWFGSFGTDTMYGDSPAQQGPVPTIAGLPTPTIVRGTASDTGASKPTAMRVYRAVSEQDTQGSEVVRAEELPEGDEKRAVLAAATNIPSSPSSPAGTAGIASGSDLSNLWFMLAAIAAYVAIFHGGAIKASFMRQF